MSNPNKKTEAFTISNPNYATLDDIHQNLSGITEQLDKISLVEGINYDSIVNKINKDVSYISTQIEKINNKSTPSTTYEKDTFTNMSSTILYPSNLGSSLFSNKQNTKKKVSFNQNTNITDVSDLLPKNTQFQNKSNKQSPVHIEQSIINKITMGSFSIVGLFILYRALHK
jgi:hypothetical protein